MKTTFSQAHDLYQIMELEHDATPDDIRHAYRKIVLEIHPDRNPSPDAHERTAAVNEAYETLKDPNKRRLYDLQLMWQRPGPRPRSERARRNNPEARRQESHRRRDQDSPHETRTDAATGIAWRRARNGNGWIIQTARCRAWVGHKAKRKVSSNIFLHDKYQQDPAHTRRRTIAGRLDRPSRQQAVRHRRRHHRRLRSPRPSLEVPQHRDRHQMSRLPPRLPRAAIRVLLRMPFRAVPQR